MIQPTARKLLLGLCIFFLPLFGICQVPVPKWVDNIGGSGDSKPTGMVVDKQNNIYISGYFSGTVDFDPSVGVKNLTSIGGYDIYVAKYTSAGALIWAESMGGDGLDQVNCMAVDKDGNVTIVGQFQSSNLDADPGPGVHILQSQGGDDIFTIHLDTNGNFLWAYAYGGSGTDRGEEVAIDSQDNIIVTSEFQSSITIGSSTYTPTGGSFNGLVVKYSPAGNVLWSLDLGQIGDTQASGVRVDKSDNIAISGVFSGQVNFNPLGAAHNITAPNADAPFIAEYNSSGSLLWVNIVSGTVVNNQTVVSIDSQNSVYFTAANTSSLIFNGSTTINLVGNSGLFIAKYSSAGAFQFVKSMAGPGATGYVYQLENDQNNNVYFTGYFSGTINFNPAGTPTQNVSDHGQRDFFLAKYDSNGNFGYAFSAGSPNCNLTLGIELALNFNNEAVLGGSFCSTVNFDASGCSTDNVTAINGTSDTFIATYAAGSPTLITNDVITPPAVTSFCGSGTPSSITGSTPSGGNGSYTYQWQSSTDGVNFIDISGATSINYTPPLVNSTIYYRRTVSSGSCAAPITSNIISFQIQPALAANTLIAPAITGFCVTGNPAVITGSTPTGGSGTYVYQWQSSTDNVTFTNIASATAKDYTPPVVNVTTYYRRTVTSGACASPLISNMITITVLPAIAANAITAPAVTNFCAGGDPAAITGSTPTGGTGTYTYQWQSSTDNINFSNIAGATAIDYNPPVTNVTTYYRRTVISGICNTPLLSNVVIITVTPAIAANAITAPAITSFCASGAPATITGSNPTGGSGTYIYQWQSSTDNVTFTNISGATARDYAPSILNATTYYRRTVTSGVCNTPLISNVVTITVLPAVAANTITAPAIAAFCANGNPSVITGSTPTGGTGSYTYQWQSSTDNVNFGNIAGATAKDYDPPVTNVTIYYSRTVTSGICNTPLLSNVVTIIVIPPVAGNTLTAPAITTFCQSGDPAIITGSTPAGGNGTFTYQWQNSTDNVNFTDIAGAIGKDFDPPVINSTTYYRRTVISGACTTPLISNVVTITVIPGIAGNTITAPAITSFCVSGPAAIITGSIPIGGSGTYIYQWQSSTDNVTFTNIVGASAKDYAPPVINATTYYRRTVTSGACTIPVLSNVVTITVTPSIAGNAITAPSVITFCQSGDPAVITGSTPTGGTGNYVYQWQSSTDNVNFSNIAGATAKDYDPTAANSTIYYRRTVTSGVCNTPLISNVVTITVTPAIAGNTITAPAVTNFCASGNPAIITGSTPTGGNGIYIYQWQSSTDNITFTDIAGASGKDYDPPVTNVTTYYRRTVTSAICTIPLTSNVVTITILPALAANTITAPAVTGFCSGGALTAITGSTPTGGTGTYTYQWQSSTDNINFSNIAGATTNDYNPTVINVTTYYRRTITSGICNTPLLSNVVTITVTPVVAANAITAPAITGFCANGNPSSIIGGIPTGGNGIFVYQWQSSADNVNFTDIAGATAKDYAPQAITATTYYRRTVTSGACTTPVISNVITITIIPAIAGNTITAPSITSFCTSGDPSVITGSTPTGGTGTYTYQWQNSTDNINFTNIAGAAAKDYDSPSLSANAWFRRTVISGICTVPLISNVVNIVITSSPATPVPTAASVSVCPGNTATLSVSSAVQGITYNWYDSPSKTNLLFSGPSFVTNPINSAIAFYVEATNGGCSSPSLATVQVNINPVPAAPLIVNNPASTCNGSPVTISISNPQPGLTYNWYAAATGGSSIFTGADFTTPALTAGATYYAEAVNSTGCTSSSRTAIVVTVNPIPLVTAQNTSVCPGSPATLTGSSTDNNAVINWYVSSTGGSILYTGSSFVTPAINSNTTYYAEALDNTTGCISASRTAATVQLIQPLAAPVVTVNAATSSSVTFQWDAVSGATGYLVSIDNGQTFTAPSSGRSGLTHTISGLQANQSITIIVKATGDEPCALSSSSTAVTGKAVSPSNNIIYVPNAFTPNGDGNNDQVHVHSESIKSLKFYVYDQWGELIFASSDQQNGWDGTFKGTKEPAGVYVYYLEAVLNDGQKMTKKGTITLLR